MNRGMNIIFRTFSILICIITFIVAGCVTVPGVSNMIVGNEDQEEEMQACAPCSSHLFALQSDVAKNRTSALNADHFVLLSWNILKARRDGWEKEFERISREVDLFIIQEACLTDKLKGIFQKKAPNWVFAPAFAYLGDHVGVLTASNALAEPICMERFQEPIVRLPKSVLITRYPLSAPGESLLVVNVHSINFALGIETFSDHWARLENFLLAAPGPVILAGDFNTWSRKRLEVVRETTHRLSLKPVSFDKGGQRTFFGNVVDHVYYRGLTPIDAEVYEVTTSDHNPMLVSFRLDAKSAAPETFLD